MSCSCFQSLWKGLIVVAEALQSFLLLAIRLVFGYQFYISGLGKFSNIADVASFFGGLGIPLPEWNAYFVASAELVGGILLILGLCTRPAALLLSILMVVALLTAHLDAVKGIFDDPTNLVNQAPFNFLLASLFLFAFGPGKISVDHLIGKWLFREE
jgi:putative oxidoreductase